MFDRRIFKEILQWKQKYAPRYALFLKQQFGKRVGTPIVLHHGEVQKKEEVLYLPYYMASLL